MKMKIQLRARHHTDISGIREHCWFPDSKATITGSSRCTLKEYWQFLRSDVVSFWAQDIRLAVVISIEAWLMHILFSSRTDSFHSYRKGKKNCSEACMALKMKLRFLKMENSFSFNEWQHYISNKKQDRNPENCVSVVFSIEKRM